MIRILASLVFASSLFIVGGSSFAEEMNCFDCHTGMQVVSKPHKDVGCSDCHSNIKKIPHQDKVLAQLGGKQLCGQCHDDVVTGIKGTKHGDQNCTSCHGGIHKGWTKAAASCAGCHEKASRDFQTATHSKKGVSCTDCHSDPHKIVDVADEQSPVSKLGQITTCGKCHDDGNLIKGFKQSDHGRGITESGLTVAPSCSTCHGSHAIYAPNNPHSKVAPKKIPDTCGSCHEYVLDRWKESVHGQLWAKGEDGPVCTNCHESHRIMDPRIPANRVLTPQKCGECHEEATHTYRDSFHGKSSGLGFATAAICSDCHTPHNILPKEDPKSSVHQANLVKTCGECHSNATASFVKFDPHVDPTNRAETHPVVHWVWFLMTYLLIGTIAFFAIHTLLWLQRAIVALVRKEFEPTNWRSKGMWVRRFNAEQQWIHVAIVMSFLLLAFTGLPLKFSGSPWTLAMSKVLGGIEVARWFHRFGGLITIGYAGYFIYYLIREIYGKRRLELLWGWKSMTPNLKDLRDIYDNVRWFLYMGPPPKLGRWSYWEKFDFFAVFWGVAMIGGSGLMLWAHELVARIVPGWVLNVAAIVHSDEALLATGFIFFFHFFHTHLRPESFPLDPVVFLGVQPVERLKHERPEEYEALLKSGELEKIKAPAPSKNRLKVAYVFGFSMLAIGLFCGAFLLVAGFSTIFH